MPVPKDASEQPIGEILESTWGDILVIPCVYPESYGEWWDLPLSIACEYHQRTVYYCHDANVLWCDGGPPEYHHHLFKLVPFAQLPPGRAEPPGT